MQENLYTPNSIRTVGGRYINILELDPETITIEDIAHALSMTPRFGGHLPVFYSVGQHSIGVHNTASAQPRQIRLQALMHDASDAIIGDMPSPIKQHLPDFKALEERIMQVFANKFGFPWPMHPAVKEADRLMLEAEWHGIMLGKDIMLGSTGPAYLLTPEFVRARFLQLFHELTAHEPSAGPFKCTKCGASFAVSHICNA